MKAESLNLEILERLERLTHPAIHVFTKAGTQDTSFTLEGRATRKLLEAEIVVRVATLSDNATKYEAAEKQAANADEEVSKLRDAGEELASGFREMARAMDLPMKVGLPEIKAEVDRLLEEAAQMSKKFAAAWRDEELARKELAEMAHEYIVLDHSAGAIQSFAKKHGWGHTIAEQGIDVLLKTVSGIIDRDHNIRRVLTDANLPSDSLDLAKALKERLRDQVKYDIKVDDQFTPAFESIVAKLESMGPIPEFTEEEARDAVLVLRKGLRGMPSTDMDRVNVDSMLTLLYGVAARLSKLEAAKDV